MQYEQNDYASFIGQADEENYNNFDFKKIIGGAIKGVGAVAKLFGKKKKKGNQPDPVAQQQKMLADAKIAEDAKKKKTMIYIGVGVGVVILAVVLIFVFKKK